MIGSGGVTKDRPDGDYKGWTEREMKRQIKMQCHQFFS